MSDESPDQHRGSKRQRDEEDEEEQHKRQAIGQGIHTSMKVSNSSSSSSSSSSSNGGSHSLQSNNNMAAAAASSMNPMAGMMPPMQSLGTGDLSAVAATLAPVLSAPGRAPIATPLHEKMQDPHYSQLMASWPEQLRRYAKRPQARRRVSVELNETERWYCPLQCGKYFKTTSTRSIAKHKISCPKLPVNSHQQMPQSNNAVGIMEQNGANRASAAAAAAAAAASSGNTINPQAASALATAAAMGLLRIPQNNAPIMPFPFPMLGQQIGQQLMLQILQQNPQASASLLAAQQQQQQQQQLVQHQQNLMLQHQHEQQQQQLLPHHQDALDGSEHLSNLPGTIKE